MVARTTRARLARSCAAVVAAAAICGPATAIVGPAAAAAESGTAGPGAQIVLRPGLLEVHEGGRITATRALPSAAVRLDQLVGLVGDPDLLRRSGTRVDLAATVRQRPGSTLVVGAPITQLRLLTGTGSTGALEGTRARLTIDGVTVSAGTNRAPTAGTVPHIRYTNDSTVVIEDSVIEGLGRREGDASEAEADAVAGYGAYVGRDSRLSITGSVFRAGDVGLVTGETEWVRIVSSRFVNNATEGLVVRGAGRARLTGLQATGNGGDGMQLVGLPATAAVADLAARGNQGSGIRVSDAAAGLRIARATTSTNGHAGVVVAGEGPLVLASLASEGDRQGLRVAGPSSQLVLQDGQVLGGPLSERGIEAEGLVRVAGSTVADAEVGVHAGPASAITLTDSSIRAARLAVDVEEGGSVTVHDTDVDAPGGVSGQIEVQGDSRISPLRLHWFGAAAAGFIILGLVLELLRRLRERDDDRRVRVADHVTNRS